METYYCYTNAEIRDLQRKAVIRDRKRRKRKLFQKAKCLAFWACFTVILALSGKVTDVPEMYTVASAVCLIGAFDAVTK